MLVALVSMNMRGKSNMANNKDFFKIKKMSLKKLLIFQRELEQKYKVFEWNSQAQNSVFAVLCDGNLGSPFGLDEPGLL